VAIKLGTLFPDFPSYIVRHTEEITYMEERQIFMFCDTETDKNFLTASGQVADVNIVTFQFLILNHQEDFFSLLVIAFSCLRLKLQKCDICFIVPYIDFRKLVMRWDKGTPSP
jgi:hypothetical protein